MKSFCHFLVAAMLACVVRAVSLSHGSVRARAEHAAALSFVRERGCNINICFAIDGSGSMSHSDFEQQKDFILTLTSILAADGNASYAAVQYGLSAYPISPLTQDADQFAMDVYGTEFKHDSKTSISAGIEYCFFEMAHTSEGIAKVVVIGDGRHNDGRDPVLSATVFKNFFGDRGSLSVVGVGFDDMEYMQRIASAAGGHVFTIDEAIELSFLVDDLIYDACGSTW